MLCPLALDFNFQTYILQDSQHLAELKAVVPNPHQPFAEEVLLRDRFRATVPFS